MTTNTTKTTTTKTTVEYEFAQFTLFSFSQIFYLVQMFSFELGSSPPFNFILNLINLFEEQKKHFITSVSG